MLWLPSPSPYMKLQTVITMINHAIGATGVVSQECKAVVQQYGQTIMELLLAEVKATFLIDVYYIIELGKS